MLRQQILCFLFYLYVLVSIGCCRSNVWLNCLMPWHTRFLVLLPFCYDIHYRYLIHSHFLLTQVVVNLWFVPFSSVIVSNFRIFTIFVLNLLEVFVEKGVLCESVCESVFVSVCVCPYVSLPYRVLPLHEQFRWNWMEMSIRFELCIFQAWTNLPARCKTPHITHAVSIFDMNFCAVEFMLFFVMSLATTAAVIGNCIFFSLGNDDWEHTIKATAKQATIMATSCV